MLALQKPQFVESMGLKHQVPLQIEADTVAVLFSDSRFSSNRVNAICSPLSEDTTSISSHSSADTFDFLDSDNISDDEENNNLSDIISFLTGSIHRMQNELQGMRSELAEKQAAFNYLHLKSVDQTMLTSKICELIQISASIDRIEEELQGMTSQLAEKDITNSSQRNHLVDNILLGSGVSGVNQQSKVLQSSNSKSARTKRRKSNKKCVPRVQEPRVTEIDDRDFDLIS